jgi:hypothetical protein
LLQKNPGTISSTQLEKWRVLEGSIEPTAQALRIFLAYGRIFFVHLSLAGVVFTTAPIDQ